MSASFPLSAGRTDEHYTPPEIFEALGCTFDLDPCQPETGRAYLSVPTEHFYTKQENGLLQPWHGFVWLNPPWGGAQWRGALARTLCFSWEWDCSR